MISIVIPAFNEEKYLPGLLESIKKQTYKDYEIIVADSDSKDKTVAIAKKFGCKVVIGGSPAVARNNGAKAAGYDLLFLDADVVLGDDNKLIEKFLADIEKNKIDVGCCSVYPTSKNILHRLFYAMKNFNNKYFGYVFGFMSGQCIFVKKEVFRKLQGFDEALDLAEEHDFQARAKKISKFHFFNEFHVHSYPRRIEKEGFMKLCMKNIYSDAARILFGNRKRVKYEFGKF